MLLHLLVPPELLLTPTLCEEVPLLLLGFELDEGKVSVSLPLSLLVQEKSSEAKSTTAKSIKRGDLVILGNIVFSILPFRKNK